MLSEMLDKALSALSAALVTHVRANKRSVFVTRIDKKWYTSCTRDGGGGRARAHVCGSRSGTHARFYRRLRSRMHTMAPHGGSCANAASAVCVCVLGGQKKISLGRSLFHFGSAEFNPGDCMNQELIQSPDSLSGGSFSLWKCRAHGDQWARGGGGLILRVGDDGDAWEANLGAAVLRHPRERP